MQTNTSEVKIKMYNYYSGWPYSEELYHHGVKGQKWGIRRYQNDDGSLTALGKVHYGIISVGRTIGSGAKTIGTVLSERYKKKHPKSMTDEELQNAIRRLDMERRYSDLVKSQKPSISRGRRVAGEIFESGAKTLASRAFNEAANKIFAEKPDTKSISYIVKRDFEREFNEQYKNGQGELPSYESVKNTASYLEELRKIENKSSKNKKK